jgi:hypothetical protein
MRIIFLVILVSSLATYSIAQSAIDSIAADEISGIYEGSYGSEKYLENESHNIQVARKGFNQVLISGERLDSLIATVFRDADGQIHLTSKQPNVRLKYLTQYFKLNIRIDKIDGSVFRFIGTKIDTTAKTAKAEVKEGPVKAKLIGAFVGEFLSSDGKTTVQDTIDVFTNDEIEKEDGTDRYIIKYGLRLVPRGYFTMDITTRIKKFFNNTNIEDLDNAEFDVTIYDNEKKLIWKSNYYGWTFTGQILDNSN